VLRNDEGAHCLRLAQFRSARPRTSVAQHWMLLYVPLQMRAAWRAERSAGAAATMALPMKALMMVEASILVVILELKVKLVEENMVR
jgi:hypothetical protein